MAGQRRVAGDAADGGSHDLAVPFLLGIERAHADDDEVGAADGGVIDREAQAPVAETLRDQLIESRLMHRQEAGVESLDAGGIDVETGDLMSDVGQAGGGHEADVAGSDDGKVHLASVAQRHHRRRWRCVQAPRK